MHEEVKIGAGKGGKGGSMAAHRPPANCRLPGNLTGSSCLHVETVEMNPSTRETMHVDSCHHGTLRRKVIASIECSVNGAWTTAVCANGVGSFFHE